MMKRTATIAAAVLLLAACGTQKDSDKVNIEKQTVQLENDQMTPEALWAMSRLSGYQASPDGNHIVFQKTGIVRPHQAAARLLPRLASA